MQGSDIPFDLRARLAGIRRVTVLTGAGVSADSGVPTFRDALTGYWARFDPEQLASPEAFRRDPRTVWQWYVERRGQLDDVEPNAGHHALARWQERLERCCIVTQNVDGLHQRAGSQEVVELHGSLGTDRCSGCGRVQAGSLDEEPPRCPACGGVMRPNVVWFGEVLPAGTLDRALSSVREADLVISAGTSALVQPAATIPLEAVDQGVPVMEVNPESTPLTPYVQWSVRAPAAETLPALVEAAGA